MEWLGYFLLGAGICALALLEYQATIIKGLREKVKYMMAAQVDSFSSMNPEFVIVYPGGYLGGDWDGYIQYINQDGVMTLRLTYSSVVKGVVGESGRIADVLEAERRLRSQGIAYKKRGWEYNGIKNLLCNQHTPYSWHPDSAL